MLTNGGANAIARLGVRTLGRPGRATRNKTFPLETPAVKSFLVFFGNVIHSYCKYEYTIRTTCRP